MKYLETIRFILTTRHENHNVTSEEVSRSLQQRGIFLPNGLIGNIMLALDGFDTGLQDPFSNVETCMTGFSFIERNFGEWGTDAVGAYLRGQDYNWSDDFIEEVAWTGYSFHQVNDLFLTEGIAAAIDFRN